MRLMPTNGGVLTEFIYIYIRIINEILWILS